jgi:hypothetical protein
MEVELSSSSMNPTEWRDWEDSLDSIDSIGPLEMDLGLDNFLTGADDFAEPFGLVASAAAQPNLLASPPDSPSYDDASPVHHFSEDEEDELLAFASSTEVFMYEHEQGGVLSEHMFECESMDQNAAAMTLNGKPQRQQRKRKSTNMQHIKEEPMQSSAPQVHPQYNHNVPSSPEKKFKANGNHKEQHTAKLDEHAERLFRRRYDILHEILEAWNTGGIEDMEEIADSVYDDDVTFISPDYTDGLRGVQALMAHWNALLDAFPDGIMEEYEIQREDPLGEKIKATWVFSGTQIYPIFGVEPRHEKVCINGTSFFSFKGEKICQCVLTWNYREALMKLMGVQPSKSVVLSAHVPAANATAAQLTTAQR